jgi:beta-glucanase (GH16 family)
MKIYFKRVIAILIIAVAFNACTEKRVVPAGTFTPPPEDKDYQFEATPFWSDEFDNAGSPDASKWNYDIGAGGWGNNELQYYTSDNNAVVQDGKLSIEARKETKEGSSYTSARLVSKGKGDFLYGRFEISAKLPAGRGLWPAIWLLSSDNAYGVWPNSGEMDIMEQVGFDPYNIHCTVHNNVYNGQRGNQKTANSILPSATSDFHVYRVDWTPYSVKGFIDGTQYFEYTNDGQGYTTWPYDQNFYLILNVAVGGNWGGANGIDDSVFPGQMQIDYVRVYKLIQ